jgi:hypothetical protein
MLAARFVAASVGCETVPTEVIGDLRACCLHLLRFGPDREDGLRRDGDA